MPDMLTLQLVRGRERELVNLSEMNEAEEAPSSSALASIVYPLGASTRTRHVINSKSEDTPEAILENMLCIRCVFCLHSLYMQQCVASDIYGNDGETCIASHNDLVSGNSCIQNALSMLRPFDHETGS